MVVALSAEGTAAVLGALAGGGIAIIGQAVFGSFGAMRARRVAAQMIYAELTGNLASAATAPGALRSRISDDRARYGSCGSASGESRGRARPAPPAT